MSHVTGNQPITDQCFLIRSVHETHVKKFLRSGSFPWVLHQAILQEEMELLGPFALGFEGWCPERALGHVPQHGHGMHVVEWRLHLRTLNRHDSCGVIN